MGNRSTEVDEYLDNADPQHRQALDQLRDVIHDVHPDVEELIEYKMPTFKVDGERITGFASRAQYISLYCDPQVVDGHRDQLGKLNVGKGCIRFRKIEQLPMDTIRQIIAESKP